MSQNLPRKCVAEFIGAFARIFIGVGAIHNPGRQAMSMGLPGGALAGLIYGHFLIKDPK